MASPYRVNRVRELLMRELSDIISQMKDPRVQSVTVVDLEVSRDLRQAKVYVSMIGGAEEQQQAVKALQKALGFIRREVAARVSLRYAPELTVNYDDTAERASRVDALFNSLRDGDEQEA